MVEPDKKAIKRHKGAGFQFSEEISKVFVLGLNGAGKTTFL